MSTSSSSDATSGLAPASVRNAAYVAFGVSLIHIIFGAIVRITGSGMGCGDNWPKCHGYWVPPFERMDLIIEVTHRYLALALLLSIAVLVYTAWRHRAISGVGSRGGVWNTALLSVVLWIAPALFGAVTVFLGNPAWATVIHKLLAASLLAVLAVAVIRAGGMGRNGIRRASGTSKAVRASMGAAILALIVVLLGGLTAKLPNAAVACVGFPLCGEGSLGGGAQHVQLTHRLLAYLLVLHLISLPMMFRKRGEPHVIVATAWIGLALGVLQVIWAGWMVTGGFPPAVRSFHQATGMLIWAVTFVMTYLARLAANNATGANTGGTRVGRVLSNTRKP